MNRLLSLLFGDSLTHGSAYDDGQGYESCREHGCAFNIFLHGDHDQ